MKILATLILSLAATLPVQAQWRSRIGSISEKTFILPPIVTVKESKIFISVFIKNPSPAELGYTGSSADSPMIFLENYKDGKWLDDAWDWCGTGKKVFSIAPGETTEFKIPVSHTSNRRRFYTIFSSKHENTASLVLLYESK